MPSSSSRGSSAGAPGRVDRGRAAGQHQAGGLERQDLLGRRVVRDHRREDAALADAARDQLAVLRPEVDDQDAAGDGGRERRVERRRAGWWSSRRQDSEGGRTDAGVIRPPPRDVRAARQRHLARLQGRPHALARRARRAGPRATRGSPCTSRTSAPAPAGRTQSSSSLRSACAERPPTVATRARTVTSRPITRTRSAPSISSRPEPAARLEADDQDGGGRVAEPGDQVVQDAPAGEHPGAGDHDGRAVGEAVMRPRVVDRARVAQVLRLERVAARSRAAAAARRTAPPGSGRRPRRPWPPAASRRRPGAARCRGRARGGRAV